MQQAHRAGDGFLEAPEPLLDVVQVTDRLPGLRSG
jgi:hypothetical protein